MFIVVVVDDVGVVAAAAVAVVGDGLAIERIGVFLGGAVMLAVVDPCALSLLSSVLKMLLKRTPNVLPATGTVSGAEVHPRC